MTNKKYKEKFESLWEVIEQFRGSLWNHPKLIDNGAAEIAETAARDTGSAPTEDDIEQAEKEIKEEVKAAFMLSRASNMRYRSLKEHLENAYTRGDDKYPSDVEALLGMLNNYRGPE
mmetsp:Transcript_7008/g.15121  ORF Transcript_7008/g.15121 Transcript_7008/m.15121 type:complete len:117 (+) Transcript_7008:813-1163(+)